MRILTIFFLLVCLTATAQVKSVVDCIPKERLVSLLTPPLVCIENRVNVKSVTATGSLVRVRLTDSARQLPITQEVIDVAADSVRLWTGIRDARVTFYTSDGELGDIVYDKTKSCGMPALGSVVRQLDEGHGGPLAGRNIALWASHGRYYEKSLARWEWQRARLFTTVEDLLTSSFVLPFLLPMLENAGAMVFMPRERDMSRTVCTVDNADTEGFSSTAKVKKYLLGWGHYDILKERETPFVMGSSAVYKLSERDSIVFSGQTTATGQMVVYLCYLASKELTDSVHVTVRHAHGESHFRVNQQKGDGMWIPLGRMPFEAGKTWSVVMRGKGLVNADAVRIGGGMGTVRRGETVSGLPAWAEGARYYLQADGFDYSSVVSLSEGANDYTDDINCRGEWVNALVKSKGINVDLALALHTDAGITPNDSAIGTLAIVTTQKTNKKLGNGQSTAVSRQLAGHILENVTSDIRRAWDVDWTSRGILDKNYSESRRPDVPTVLLELLSHQNVTEIDLALHPAFRRDASRAIYKGVLRYLCGADAPVAPLAPSRFGVEFVENCDTTLRLSWVATVDSLEASARADYFVVLQDEKILMTTTDTTAVVSQARDGLVRTYQVVAVGRGGRSMPSEQLSACLWGSAKKALIVKGMDRLASPKTVRSDVWTGVVPDVDGGVAWDGDAFTAGDQYDYDPESLWTDDDSPGCGASYSNREAVAVSGYGRAEPSPVATLVQRAGYSFVMQSKDYFDNASITDSKLSSYSFVRIDLERQRTTNYGDAGARHTIYTDGFMHNVAKIVRAGVRTVISGSFVGADIGDDATRRWCQQLLGFKHRTNHASYSFEVSADSHWLTSNCLVAPAPESVWHLQVDAIEPAVSSCQTVVRYVDSQMSAGVERENVVVVGF